MRALLVSWEYPPVIEGGLGRHVRKLSEHLSSEGIEVHVLTRGGGRSAVWEERHGVVVHRVREPDFPRDVTAFVHWVRAMNRDMLERRLVRSGYDVISAADGRPEKGLWTENEQGLPVTVFEAQDDEFRAVEVAFTVAHSRWPNGMYAIWYPIKLRQQTLPFQRWFARHKIPKVLCAELLLHPDNSALRLNGCGMIIVNPPWKFERQLEELLPVLRQHLAQGRFGEHHVSWLTPE